MNQTASIEPLSGEEVGGSLLRRLYLCESATYFP